jgi:hypothetical protein
LLLRLLRYFPSIGVVALGDDDRFQLTATGRLLDPAAPDSLHPWVLLRSARLREQGALDVCVRTGSSHAKEGPGTDNFSPLGQDLQAAAVFHAAMVAMTRRVAAQLVPVLEFAAFAIVVDVGGGSGELACTLLRAHPGMVGTVFDLEHAREGAMAHPRPDDQLRIRRHCGGSLYLRSVEIGEHVSSWGISSVQAFASSVGQPEPWTRLASRKFNSAFAAEVR